MHTEGYTAGRAVRAVRGMRVSSRRLGIAGVADIVEFSQEDSTARLICPVEYKVGKPKVEDWDRLQVCAQALCLEEMFDCSIRVGALFYGETRRRERFELDEPLRLRVEELAERMRGLFEIGRTPLAEKGPKCRRCSLADICLPEALGRDVDAYWSGRS